MGTVIDGKALASATRDGLAERVRTLRDRGVAVRLDAVLAAGRSGSGAAARVYAENQARTTKSLGIDYHLHELDADADQDEVLGRVLLLNEKPSVHAVMVHLPLPAGVDPYIVQSRISPPKDVEGVNPANIGNIIYGQSSLVPCTALAVLRMIESTGLELRGARAVVVGASDIVGKPLAALLMQREATVISCNKFTEGIVELSRSADVVIAAAGVAGLIGPEWVKPGATVIDVGIHRVKVDPPLPDGTKMRTVGDVRFDEVEPVAGAISPVPGGVGPMTVAALLSNVVDAAERSARGA
ncbi:MAG: bifunctional 5,10-methylenetetrahydrofolate dehydrogenase/5,10-methenyltetrahydrofolate cyclohydrolase [Planctomycetota bacterium]